MKKQIALAYGIAGIAVAVAIVTVVDARTALFEPGAGGVAAGNEPPRQDGASPAKEPASPEPRQRDVVARPQAPIANQWPTQSPQGRTTAATGELPVEVVYVDEPASARGGRRYEDRDDEEDERWEHEDDDDERWEHEEDDDD